MKYRVSILVALLLLALSTCRAPGAAELPPTPFPDTPAPAQVNAPLVESPAFVTFHFLNELDGWGVTETQIVRTNDGGITWYDLTPPGVTETGYSVQTFALDANRFWMQIPDFENFHGGTLHRTTDGGLTWSNFSTPFSGVDMQFLDANNGWALADLGVGAGSNAIAIYKTTDGGAAWTQKFTNEPNLPDAGKSLPLGGFKSGIAPLDMQTAWVYGVVYSSGTLYLYRTEDGGANWTPVVSPPLPQGAENFELGVDPEHMHFVSSMVGFMAVRMSGTATETALYITNDAGNTWSLTPTQIPGGGAADFLSDMEMVIFNGEQFYVTRDAARTWSIIPPDVIFGDTFARMDFVNVMTGWVLTMDPADNRRTLYRTTDGGATWSPVIP